MADRCSSCCGDESPLLSCEEIKAVKWEVIKDDYSSTAASILHSLRCGELTVRSEAMTVLCSQLLTHLCADDAFLINEGNDLSFPTDIETVVKSTGGRICDLLNQQKVDDATAELEFFHHCVAVLLQCAHSYPDLCTSLGYQFCCLPAITHLLTFCRDTERSCMSVMQSLSPLLGDLFKSSYSLLKLCLEGTEHVTVDHTHLTHLLSVLTRLAEVAVTFDPSLILLCWKFLAKLVCRMKSHIPDITQTIQPIIEQLCVAMETKSAECVMSVREVGGQMFAKLIKLCRFLSTLLVKMLSEFDELCTERVLCLQLIRTLLNVHTAVIQSGCHGNQWKEFESNILIVREPLIQVLIHSTNFVNQLLDKELVGDGEHAAWALCLCTLIKLFPTMNEGVQDDVMGERTSLQVDCHTCKMMDALFSALSESYVDIASPVRVGGIMCNGQPQRMVTLYEHILTHLSSLILCLPDRHRTKMEHVLLGYLFSAEPHCSLLAADSFIFLSKRAGPDTTLLHAQQLCTLLSSLPCGHWQLSSVVDRLFSLLPPSHVHQLSTLFHRDQFPLVWMHLSSTGHLDASQLHRHLLEQLNTQMSALTPDLVAMHATLEQLSCVVIEQTSLPPSLSSLPEQLLSVLTSLPLSSQLASEVVAMVIHLSSLLLSHCPSPNHLVPLFQVLHQLLSLHPLPQPFALATPVLLKESGHLTLPQKTQSEVLAVIAAAFQTLLSHRSWLVQTLALEAFRSFAEHTPYPAIGEKCIPEDLSDHVVNFLHKVPYGQESINTEQLKSILKSHQRPQSTPTISEATPPPADGLHELVKAWKAMSRVQEPSPWLLTQLKQLCYQIQTFLSEHS